MLSSTRSKRLFILASVKFLSRASTALNFDPSMATLAALKQIKLDRRRGAPFGGARPGCVRGCAAISRRLIELEHFGTVNFLTLRTKHLL
jgi:hypothetical protein